MSDTEKVTLVLDHADAQVVVVGLTVGTVLFSEPDEIMELAESHPVLVACIGSMAGCLTIQELHTKLKGPDGMAAMDVINQNLDRMRKIAGRLAAWTTTQEAKVHPKLRRSLLKDERALSAVVDMGFGEEVLALRQMEDGDGEADGGTEAR